MSLGTFPPSSRIPRVLGDSICADALWYVGASRESTSVLKATQYLDVPPVTPHAMHGYKDRRGGQAKENYSNHIEYCRVVGRRSPCERMQVRQRNNIYNSVAIATGGSRPCLVSSFIRHISMRWMPVCFFRRHCSPNTPW